MFSSSPPDMVIISPCTCLHEIHYYYMFTNCFFFHFHVYTETNHEGCPRADSIIPGGRAVHLFFFLLLVMLIYCSLGYVYNVKFKGASGIEAVPHILFLRYIYVFIQTFIHNH